MKVISIALVCVCLYLVCSAAIATLVRHSGSRSKPIHLLHGSRSFSRGSNRFGEPLKSFNRPPGTKALQTSANSGSFENTYGRTFGQYGSYRDHKTWQTAVRHDNLRHSLIRNNLRDTFPWLFKNINTPSLRGFGLDGFWNSYTPFVADGTAASAVSESEEKKPVTP